MKTLLTLFVLFFSSSVTSEGLATWGYTGDKCNALYKAINKYDKKIATHLLVAHLTGYNVASNFIEDKTKILNHNTKEYLLEYVLNECEKRGEEEYILVILYHYWESLPDS